MRKCVFWSSERYSGRASFWEKKKEAGSPGCGLRVWVKKKTKVMFKDSKMWLFSGRGPKR